MESELSSEQVSRSHPDILGSRSDNLTPVDSSPPAMRTGARRVSGRQHRLYIFVYRAYIRMMR